MSGIHLFIIYHCFFSGHNHAGKRAGTGHIGFETTEGHHVYTHSHACSHIGAF